MKAKRINIEEGCAECGKMHQLRDSFYHKGHNKWLCSKDCYKTMNASYVSSLNLHQKLKDYGIPILKVKKHV